MPPNHYDGLTSSEWNELYPIDTRHTIRNSYSLNSEDEVNKFIVNTIFTDGVYKNSISQEGYYSANTLTKSIIKNENWKPQDLNNNTIVEFKDSKGNVVLKRMFNNNERHDTYYVYNNLDLLVFVIPPMADGTIDSSKLNLWCYQYNYDAKNRLVEKKLPQKDWEYIIYDKMDRQVMSGPAYSPFGDGTKGWLITKYDVLGRVAYTGFYGATSFTSETRNSLSQNSFSLENRNSTSIIDGISLQYTNTSFPTSFKLLSVNYYDNYNYPSAPTSFPVIEEITPNTNVKGQLTGTWVRTLTSSTSTSGTLSYNFYDDKYRVIREYTTNHLGGYTQVDNKLSFTGVPTKTVSTQKQNSNASLLVITDQFSYDRRNRLVSQTQKINDGAEEKIFVDEYDELGVLITKRIGVISNEQLQKINYKYNIRGWLTDINNADSDISNSDDNDLFQLKINYHTTAMINDNLYNGNINSVWTRTKKDNRFKGYAYWYDDLNRLIDAQNMTYHKPGGWLMGQRVDDSYRESLSYDKNGNILTLYRTTKVENQKNIIDNLSYTYSGNQVMSVTDSTAKNEGFADGNIIGDDYQYDAFGNQIVDKNKKITQIKYNHLNLPLEITTSDGKIKYVYSAGGAKVKKIIEPLSGTIQTTDYLYGFQYTNNELEFFPQTEGYVKPNGTNAYLYVYQHKDHLGNVRLSYADVDGNHTINPVTEILEVNNYYPFGLQHTGYGHIDNAHRSEEAEQYKLNGKEYEDAFGLNIYEMDLRQYDPAIGRWVVQDPVIHHNFSPYNAFDNNPAYWSDPSGANSQTNITLADLWNMSGSGITTFNFENGVLVEGSHTNVEQVAQNSYEFSTTPGDTGGGGGDGNGNGGGNKKNVKNVNEVSSYRGVAFVGPYFYFENLSSYDYYIKPENSNEAILVKPGQIYVGRIDGFASKELGIIVKVSDFMSPVATDKGVSYRKSIMQNLMYNTLNKSDYQQINHSFLKSLHKSGDYGWDNLFNKLIH